MADTIIRTLVERAGQSEGTDRKRDVPDDGRPPAFTDEALALRFAERHASNLRSSQPGRNG
jgi:hypothetical protein